MMIKHFILFITLTGYSYLSVAQTDMVVFLTNPGHDCEIEYLYVNRGDEICAEYQLGNHESWGRIYTVCTTVE